MQNTCKEALYHMIRTKSFAEAAAYTKLHIREYQNEEYFVLFYILFRIWEEEKKANIPDFFSSPLGHEPDVLLAHYTQIKLYLRRLEYQMPDAIQKEAFEYFNTYQVSPYALYRIAQFACIRPYIAFQELAKMYEADGNQNFADIFYETAKNEKRQ